MVRFTKDGFSIDVKTACPIDEWQGLYEDLSWVFNSLSPDRMPKEGLWRLANLIAELTPDYKTAKKMIE